MTRPRSALIAVESTPYYHLVARCVRRAFLCGNDLFSGRSYEHRRQWVVEKLAELDNVFAINICAYAVMSNHYHLVVRINPLQAQAWSEEEVIARWLTVFSGPVLIQRYRRGEALSKAEREQVGAIVAEWRQRLSSISWLMRILNESIARKANEEDNCTGRFWEGRFKSQALLDEAAVISAMAYVDLNPVRAGLAATPETSDYTSVQQRITQQQANNKSASSKTSTKSVERPTLLDLATHIRKYHDDKTTPPLPIGYADYLALVDWTGRAIREDKRGCIPAQTPPILERLHIDPDYFIAYCKGKSKVRCTALGSIDRLRQHASRIGQRWVQGISLVPT